jgi:hypothetical protein
MAYIVTHDGRHAYAAPGAGPDTVTRHRRDDGVIVATYPRWRTVRAVPGELDPLAATQRRAMMLAVASGERVTYTRDDRYAFAHGSVEPHGDNGWDVEYAGRPHMWVANFGQALAVVRACAHA